MKTAAIVFLVIGMVTAGISVLEVVTGSVALTEIIGNVIVDMEGPYESTYYLELIRNILLFATIVGFIASLIIGILAIKSLKEGKRNIVLGVLALIFCNLIGGILYLAYNPETDTTYGFNSSNSAFDNKINKDPFGAHENDNVIDADEEFYCPVCGFTITKKPGSQINFCPKCGAKLEKRF